MLGGQSMEQSKRGGGDRSSRSAQVQARENEQRALALWLKGATFGQISTAGFGITTPSGAWRAVYRALQRIPKAAADQARQAQLARLQELRLLLWNQTRKDPIRAAEALIKLEAREARLLGLDEPEVLNIETEADWERKLRQEQLKWFRLMTQQERDEYRNLFERLEERARSLENARPTCGTGSDDALPTKSLQIETTPVQVPGTVSPSDRNSFARS
jgi:hypothetical protein